MRSKFIVHWPGKEFEKVRDRLQDKDREDYVSRLSSVLEHGFWMTIPEERIEGNKGSWIEYAAPMTCFTEIRLSQAHSHADRYGLLGIGVSRQFVLDLHGGPVHYVRNHEDECVVGNVQEVLKALKGLGRPDLVSYFAVNTSFIKGMSEANKKDNFWYLEEQEWRIVQTNSQVDAGKIVEVSDPPPAYLIPIQLGDVRIIVFPDNKTLTMARSDPFIKDWLHDHVDSNVILLTLDECEQF